MDLLKALQWRYAVKKFDPSKEVDQQLVDKIIEAGWPPHHRVYNRSRSSTLPIMI